MSIVSSSGILVNKDWMLNEAIYKLVLLLRISFENENESLTVYSLMVNSLSIDTKKSHMSFTGWAILVFHLFFKKPGLKET